LHYETGLDGSRPEWRLAVVAEPLSIRFSGGLGKRTGAHLDLAELRSAAYGSRIRGEQIHTSPENALQ